MEGHFDSFSASPAGAAPSRRLASISAHLQPEKLAMAESAFLDALSLAPTAASHSVFEGVQQAPEDPILGVIFPALVQLLDALESRSQGRG